MYRFTEKMEAKTKTYSPNEKFDRFQMMEIYNSKDVDKEEYSNFEDWMHDMRESGNVVQEDVTEDELYAYAWYKASHAVFIDGDYATGTEYEKDLSGKEMESLRALLYGGLETILHCTYFEREKMHLVAYAMEYASLNMFDRIASYKSVYLPIVEFYES